MIRALLVAFATGALLALGTVTPPTALGAGPVAGDWGANPGSLRGQNGARFDFVCPAAGALGSVWGSGPYTDDSSVCTAAAHAGVVSVTMGGLVTIEIRPDAPTLMAALSNGPRPVAST